MKSDINDVLQIPKRKLIVSSQELNLNKIEEGIFVFILTIQESFGSAGGRGGGSGNRKIDQIIGYKSINKDFSMIFKTEDIEIIKKFDIPYSAVAMDIILESGQPYVVQGIIDIKMIEDYLKNINYNNFNYC